MPSPRAHLTYCTNVHPAETAAAVEAVVRGPAARVREALWPQGSMGLGLRLSDSAARTLVQDAGAQESLAGALDEHGLYAFTVNGFVHGGFQVDGLKEQVYAPPWTEAARVAYTLRAAEALAGLLPDGVTGSVSTLAGTFRPWADGAYPRSVCAARYVEAVEGLRALRDRTGRTVRLAIEPEPWTTLQSCGDAPAFWEEHLRPAASGRLSAEDLDELVGVCFDACHEAVGFEDPAGCVTGLVDAGVPIHKVQISNALEVERPAARPDAVARLRAFDEPRFLHQTTGRRPDGTLLRAVDLPDVLPAGAPPSTDWLDCEAWRIHFHVAVFLEDAWPLGTTRAHLLEALSALVEHGGCDHFEVETYTFDVTPDSARAAAGAGVVEMLVEELRFAEGALADLGVGGLGAPDQEETP